MSSIFLHLPRTRPLQVGFSDDPQCQFHAALCYRKLSPNVASHKGVVMDGGLPPLFKLSKAPFLEARIEAAIALRDFAADPEYKLMFGEEGGVRVMIDITLEEDIRLQCLSMAGLRHLSLNDDMKVLIVEQDGLTPIFSRCTTTDAELQRQCIGVVANLTERVKNQSIMARHQLGFSSLVTLSSVEQDCVQEDCARLCQHLFEHREPGGDIS